MRQLLRLLKMLHKLNIGVIGCGMVGEHHIHALLNNKNVNLKWVCDTDGEKLNRIRKKYSIKYYTNKHSEVILDENTHAVIICTQPNTHFELAAFAINAGKHVLVEKPLVMNNKELIEILKIVNSYPNLVIMDASIRHSRLQPKFTSIKSIIDSGRLGEVYAIHHNVIKRQSRPGIEYHPKASWFYNKKLSGGGPLLDWGVYDLSFHLGILGDTHNVQSVKSWTFNGLDQFSLNNQDFSVEEHGIVMLEFDQNLVYYWERASNAHNESLNETRIYGKKGGLKFNYLSWESNKVIQYYLDKNGKACENCIMLSMDEHNTHLHDFDALDEHFIDCILGYQEPIVPVSLACKYLNIIFQI